MSLTVVILTKNEEQHIVRALASVAAVADRCFVIDSGSTDRTVSFARDAGAVVLESPWVNYATQFNLALSQLPDDTDWVLRLDADEVVTEALAREISHRLALLPEDVAGVYVPRRMKFLGRDIRWGGVFPVHVMRLFRYRRGRCENRWMDEHIIITGRSVSFNGEIIDDNLNYLSWWTDKHNSYASREVVDLLNLEFGFMPHETVADLRGGQQASVKRWLKEKIYARLPGGARAFVYFFYRYILRLGFLDGKEGAAFHVLQGFWYRFLVDAKLQEVKVYMRLHGVDVVTAINVVLGIKVDTHSFAVAIPSGLDGSYKDIDIGS